MSLKKKLIRLAYEQPQLREDILPLLKDAGEFTEQEWKTHKQKHPNADKKDHTITKGDGGGSGGSTSKKTNIFKKVDKMKKDLESFAKDNDLDLDFDDIMYLEEEWEDALYDLKDEDEDKAEEFEEMMTEFLKQNEKKMEIADKFESMAEDLEKDKSAKDNTYVLQMIDEGGAGSDPSKHYEVLKGALDWMKDPSKSNRKNITDEQIAKNRQYGHSADKPGGLKKEERIKILERYVGELEKVMSGKKASLRDSLIRLAYAQPQLRGDLLPLITKSAAETFEDWVKKQNQKGFPNPHPKRRNKIKFKSLPKEDQKKIREDWTKAKEKADAEKEAKKPESHKKFDEMFKKLDPDVSEELPSPDQMDEWGEGDTLAEKYELWLEENSWVKGENEDENGVDDNDRIKEWIDDHASKWEEQTKSKGKKATLRSSLIRLAYEQPQLRGDILPLITKSAGEHYDRWELWSKLLSNYNLIAEIERRPVIPGSTELHIFSSRYKQYHNVDHQMGDVSASITYYDRTFTVHTGNKHSQYSIGDEKRALKSIVQYLLFSY